MKWDAPSIARFAADAGFMRPDLHTATALALATTAGMDHFDWPVGFPGTGRYVGLWAIDADQHPEWSPDWLKRPENAATAAHDLTVRFGGFGWSAAWAAGRDQHYLAHAATAYTLEPFKELPSSQIRSRLSQHRIDAMGPRLRKLARNG